MVIHAHQQCTQCTLVSLTNEHDHFENISEFYRLLALIRACLINYFGKFFLPACSLEAAWLLFLSYYWRIPVQWSNIGKVFKFWNIFVLFTKWKRHQFWEILLCSFSTLAWKFLPARSLNFESIPSCLFIRACLFNRKTRVCPPVI